MADDVLSGGGAVYANPSGGGPDTTLGLVNSNMAADQTALQDQEATLANDRAALQDYTSQRDADIANFDPEGAAGPRPEFLEPTPQDHFQDVMKVSPLLMALGAIGGAFTKQHGITMLASTNAMMKGVVQGDADAYKQAREDYEERYQNFRDKSKTWLDVYKAYSTAYKGRIDADKLAVIGANNAVGADSKDIKMTKGDIARMIQIRDQIDKQNAQAMHMQTEDVATMIRADAARQNAATNASKAPPVNDLNAAKKKKLEGGASGAGGGSADADVQQTVALGNELLQQLRSGDTGTFGGAGVGGMLSRGKEYVATKLDKNAPRPATSLATKANLFVEKMTAALKVKGQRMDAGDRIVIREAIDFIHSKGISDPIAADKVEEALRVIQKQSGTKAAGGKMINGQMVYKHSDGKLYDQPEN